MQRELLKLILGLLRNQLSKTKRRKGSGIAIVVGLTMAVFAIQYYLKGHDAPLPDPGTDLSCNVRDVHDGDTVEVGCEGGKLKVRVWGIDAPEMGQYPWGEQSRDQLRAMLRDARVQVQSVDKDRYGRLVARLFVGAQDVGLAMVREGRAIVYAQYNNSNVYRAAQSEAKADKRGVWAKPGPQQDPAAWRKLNPRS